MNFPAQTPDRQLPDGMGKAKAFTLIELLVAIGVTALLVSLMLTIVMNVSDGWNRSSGSLETGNQARTILDQMTSDLQGAILKNDGNVWMAAKVQSASIYSWTTGQNTLVISTATPPKLEDYRFGPYGVWFGFFTTVPGANSQDDPATTTVNESLTTLSAPRAVSYQIVKLPVVRGSAESRYELFRAEVHPDDTFKAGYDLLDVSKYPATVTDPGPPPVDPKYVYGPDSLRTPDRSNVIANNVVDFGVRLSKTNGTTILFPVVGAGELFVATSDTTKATNYTTRPPDFPDTVEVFVRILSAEGARQLALFENPPTGYTAPAGATWWSIVEANSRVYTRRVDLKAKSL